MQNPAPPKVVVCSRRRVICTGITQFNYLTYTGSEGSDPGNTFDGSGFAHADVGGSIVGFGTTATANSPGNGTQTKTTADESFVAQILNVSGGMAQTQFAINGGMSLSMDNEWPLGFYSIQSAETFLMDFCVAGFDLGRFGSKLNGVSGGHTDKSEDPSFTRWLPLAFSPTISSQPFRTQPGALPAPWGNVACAYSIAMCREANPANPDLDGQTELYIPTGSYGNYNAPTTPYVPLPGPFVPYYVITDANGDRLVFDKNWNPYGDIHSHVSYLAGNLTLSSAGPPGALKSLGTYTYNFQVSAVDNTNAEPIFAFLTSISEPLDPLHTNTQTLQWSNGSTFLTVIDSSTGQSAADARKLIFHAGANGYLSGVDTSIPNTNTPYTHTALTFDAGGHMTNLRVYTGDGQTLLHQDSYVYGGSNGDSVVGTQQGLAVTSYVYADDAFVPDPQGLSVPRLISTLLGNSADTSSSDNGQSIQGIFQYTWGPMQQGYGAFDPRSHTNTVTDPLGNLTLVQFGLTGDIVGVLNSLTTTSPDYAGTPAGSNVSKTFYYPDVTSPTQVLFYDPLNNLGLRLRPWQSNFDPFGNLISSSDPLLNTWSLVYDTAGLNLLSTQDPTGVMTHFQYGENNNPANLLTSIQDASGITGVQWNYNIYGQPLTQTVPASASGSGLTETSLLNYDPITGDLIGFMDPKGDQLTVNGYDPLGDPLSTSLYPDTGNPATSLTPLTSTVTWDAAQQLAKAGLPNGVQIQGFRTNGILTDVQVRAPVPSGSSLLSQIHYDYDSRGRVYNVSDLLGTVAQYRFDKNSNPTRVLDAAGHATQFTYGHNNELTSMIWPDQQHGRYVFYDANGRVQSTVDEKFTLVQYLYDDADRVTDIIRPATPTQNIHITYDAADRPLVVSDGTGQREYSYDPVMHRVIRVRTTFNALPVGHNVFDITYGYNPDGSVATMASPAGTTAYSYDASGELIRLVDPSGNITTWSRDHVGRTLQQSTHTTAGATIGTNYAYGSSNQPGDTSTAPLFLTGITQTINGQVSYAYSLEHDYLGNILAVQGNGTNPGQQRSATFSYDLRGRMTSAFESFAPDSQHTFTSTGNYTYDLSDNLMGGGGGWTYNANNQLTSAPASGGLTGATGLQYDPAGDLTAIDGHTLAYDTQGQLSGVDNSVAYTHDSSGHMTSRTSGGQSTYYLYDGDSLVAEVDGTGAVSRAYTWGDEGLISSQTGNQPTFARFDPLGNLSGQITSLGALAQEVAYKAYGGSLGGAATNTAFAWQGISGAYTDSSYPGIVMSGSRPYLPDVGRFGSASAAGSGGYTNPYAYAGGNPAGYSAPAEGDEDDYDSGLAMYRHMGQQGVRELTSMPAYQPGSKDRRDLSGMASGVPYAGEVYMGYMALSGKDPIAGTCLSTGDRISIALTLALPGVASKVAKTVRRVGPNQLHHVFPREFAARWEQAGIEYHEYTIPVERNYHQNVIHGGPGKGGAWNGEWRTFLKNNPNATPEEMWDQMRQMRKKWGIDGHKFWVPYPEKYR
ncbi:MAG: repeat-associated core domain protein [Chthonomonadaceae bacterium]|nr:repeat-associated core domain protein [Chthonomonadaceae bacterium]